MLHYDHIFLPTYLPIYLPTPMPGHCSPTMYNSVYPDFHDPVQKTLLGTCARRMYT